MYHTINISNYENFNKKIFCANFVIPNKLKTKLNVYRNKKYKKYKKDELRAYMYLSLLTYVGNSSVKPFNFINKLDRGFYSGNLYIYVPHNIIESYKN